jgi:hypothetical protein
MSTAIAKALQGLALESGEVVEDAVGEFHDSLGELLVSESQVAQEPTITDQVNDAAKASDVTEQLDELAVRADEVAAIESPAVAQVAVESLHREFKTIMRANQLPFEASSFESVYSIEGQAKGLGQDARRVAGYSRSVAAELRGHSQEAGTIVQTIRRDASRLIEANGVLTRAIPAVQHISESLKEHPVRINHSGSALFLTVDGKPALNAKTAVDQEVAQLHKLHDAIVEAFQVVLAGAHAFEANPHATIESLLPASKFAKLNDFAQHHHFMGNRTIVGMPSKGLPVLKFHRINENKLQGWNATKAVAWMPLAAFGWGFLAGAAIYIGGLVTGGLIPAIAATSVVYNSVVAGYVAGGIKSGVDSYNKNVNMTDDKSAASSNDFIKMLQELQGLTKLTSLNLPDGEVMDILDKVHKAGGPSSTYGAFEDVIGYIATAVDCLYEQALYDVIEGSKIAAQVTKKL